MKNARLFLFSLLFLVLGCAQTESRTQLTFSIDASAALQRKIASLQILVRSSDRGDQPRTFMRADLDWPVEIVVVPAEGNQSSREITLIAKAFDASGQLITDRTARSRFTPELHGEVKMTLVDTQAGEMPVEEPDAGEPSEPTPEPDAGSKMDAKVPDAEPPAPTEDAGPKPAGDAGPPPVDNCVTNLAIVCSDGNPCNGTERCEPGSQGASDKGCIPGTDIVTCGSGTTCDKGTGRCSECLANADGDGDGVTSVSCGGRDCADDDPTIAPGKPELCDNKDNNCDRTVDGTSADCAASAPQGGTATCVSGQCKASCTTPGHQIEQGVCKAPPPMCPTPNPCAPGTCMPTASSYTCVCPTSHGSGVGSSRCVARGVPERTIGFETDCAGAPTGLFMAERATLPKSAYATCGIALIGVDATAVDPQLIQPGPTTTIEGISPTTAGAVALVGGASTVSFTLSPAVNEISFDVLDLDNPSGVLVTFESAAPAAPVIKPFPVLVGTKRARVVQSSTAPIQRVVVSYPAVAVPPAPSDPWYLDNLRFLVAGCGDGVRDMAAGEECDDGNAVQCDGCDNACKSSVVGCLRGATCMAAPMSSDGGAACAP